MLLQLQIQNFAIVRFLDIDWQPGMTTITGETGAGKSIAIDALGLCLGDRAISNVVRPGCKKTELAATFDISNNHEAKQWLTQQDIGVDDECILRRVISLEGRSKAYINGSKVPLAQLKDIGCLLINIHGQHDHQLIVKSNEQRKILDNFADHTDLLNNVSHYYQQWRKLTNELSLLQENKMQREAKQQLFQYQVNELNEFSLQQGEFQDLEIDYRRHSNGQHLLNETLQSLQLLSENEQFNVVDQLRKSCEQISKLSSLDRQLSNTSKILNECLIQIEDANAELKQYYEKLELDPQAYHLIEERYSVAIQLAKKHQVPPENLPDFHQQLLQELQLISTDETRLTLVNDEIDRCRQSYLEAANQLTLSRAKAAKKLGGLISDSMKELNMPHGLFNVAVSPQVNKELAMLGLDNIEFLVTLNPGQALEAINKVASGGELSRISLAMQVILADKVVTPALIFDEVDVGISGPTAAMVGAKLQQLANKTQVICVTHLPQVASKGHQQLFVAKLTDKEHTETIVTELSEQGRVQEIARLLAGDKVTDNSLANAQELLAS